jgi:altronate dehydratase small subunit
MSNQKQAIIIDPKDNVATAIRDLKEGDAVETEAGSVVLACDIPFGHKFALTDIPEDEYVIKYGTRIGRATSQIDEGDHVHVHNVEDITDKVRKGV